MPFLSFIATRNYIGNITKRPKVEAQDLILDFFDWRRPMIQLIPHHGPSIEEHLSVLENFVEASQEN